MKTLTFILLIGLCHLGLSAKDYTGVDKLKALEEKQDALQNKQRLTENLLQTLALKLATEEKENAAQRATIDSLQGLCRQLSDTQAEDRMAINENMLEESVKLDNKLLEFAEKQLETAPQVTNKAEQDHSLALKVADEIVRIELNMSRMDASVKGYKQLAKAVQRIKDNFSANGYEIVDMLGKPYSDGMKVTANFVSDEGLEQGKQVITGITKPQINYNSKMIQAAQITVSQNI